MQLPSGMRGSSASASTLGTIPVQGDGAHRLASRKPHAGQAILVSVPRAVKPKPKPWAFPHVWCLWKVETAASWQRQRRRRRRAGAKPALSGAGRQRHRLPEGIKKQFPSRREELVSRDKTSRLVYQRQVPRYEGTKVRGSSPPQEIGHARPSATAVLNAYPPMGWLQYLAGFYLRAGRG